MVVEGRPAYLLVTERGSLTSVRDVERYAAFVEAIATRRTRVAVLIDARLGEPASRAPDVREAFWAWLGSREVIFRVAWVLPTAAEVEQAEREALVRDAPVRAFTTAQEAHHWLTTGQATTGQATGGQATGGRATGGRPAMGPAATAPTLPAMPATRSSRPSPTREAVDRVVRASAPGTRRPSPGPIERVEIVPRGRESATVSVAVGGASSDEGRRGGSARIGPVTVEVAPLELERTPVAEPPRDARTVTRSDVVPRGPVPAETPADRAAGTGSDDER